MVFVMRGKLLSATTNGWQTGFLSVVHFKASDFCGDHLLTWALDPQSWSHFPISTRTVQALTEVEAFSLAAEDLKSAASQFRRLHSKQLQHTFQVLFLILSLSLLKVNYNLFLCNVVRLYSVQWRTWGASFVQAAWRRHCRRKLTKSLQEEKDRLRDALERANEIQQPRVRHRRWALEPRLISPQTFYVTWGTTLRFLLLLGALLLRYLRNRWSLYFTVDHTRTYCTRDHQWQ